MDQYCFVWKEANMIDKKIRSSPVTVETGHHSIAPAYRPRERGNLQRKDLHDGCVLYDREKGSVYALNITSSFYLTYCTGDYTLEQIARESALATGIDTEEALKDVVSTIALFHENGILESG